MLGILVPHVGEMEDKHFNYFNYLLAVGHTHAWFRRVTSSMVGQSEPVKDQSLENSLHPEKRLVMDPNYRGDSSLSNTIHWLQMHPADK